MSAPSKQDARPPTLVKKKKVVRVTNETPRAGSIPSSAAAEVKADDELCCLSGDKPFFDVILSKKATSSLHNLTVPAHMVPKLPRKVVPMVLTHGTKDWNTSYNGNPRQNRFEPSGWRSFVVDNKLQRGDACIFELMELSTTILRFRVVILRNTTYLPPELMAIPDGRTRETAIEID